jgi:hypothetical protein
MMSTKRTTASPWELLRDAAGPPRVMAKKLLRFGGALRAFVDFDALDARLRRLQSLGLIDTVPNRVQLIVGSIDMLRFWIVPASVEYYQHKGIDFRFHQLLRLLDDPASLIDPTGFLSGRDVIIGHVLQVVHANPAYDLQLLESHEGGLESLEEQTVAMIEGTHPRSASIGAIVEDPDYHRRLLEYVRQYRRDRSVQAPVRENVAASPQWLRLERTFGTLPAAMRYFARLPSEPIGAAHHVRTVKTFPVELAEPA